MPLPQDIHQAIIEELRAQKQQRHSLWLLIDKTEVLDEKPGQFIYRLTLAEEIRVPPDSTLVIKVPGQDGSFEVQVLHAAERTLVVMSQQPLPHQMAMVRVEFDPTFILKKLDEHLDQVLRFPPAPLKALLARALPAGNSSTDAQTGSGAPRHDERLNQFQHDSVLRMQSDAVHLLWGPPGTGKTHTVGISVSGHVHRKKTCLLLSTSNSAVDEMVRATRRALGDEGLEHVFRAGVTADKEIQPFTCIGLLERREPELAAAVRRAEQRLRELTLNLPTLLKTDSSGKIFEEMQQCKNLIAGFAAQAKAFAESLAADSRCVAATLAMLVINATLSEREFDVVYIDEASMVSLPFAFAGAAQAAEQVIFAGDFRQLPPICHSEKREVREWFGRNVFDYLGVSQRKANGILPPFVSMLREQYRMTESIAQVVSDLSYFGKLITNEGIGVGKRPVFVDISQLCPTSPYSIHESSYYQPHSLLLLSAICTRFHEWLGPDNLLLSPFRAQRALLDAASKDLSKPNRQLSASTIHKAQGSQEHTVIVVADRTLQVGHQFLVACGYVRQEFNPQGTLGIGVVGNRNADGNQILSVVGAHFACAQIDRAIFAIKQQGIGIEGVQIDIQHQRSFHQVHHGVQLALGFAGALPIVNGIDFGFQRVDALLIRFAWLNFFQLSFALFCLFVNLAHGDLGGGGNLLVGIRQPVGFLPEIPAALVGMMKAVAIAPLQPFGVAKIGQVVFRDVASFPLGFRVRLLNLSQNLRILLLWRQFVLFGIQKVGLEACRIAMLWEHARVFLFGPPFPCRTPILLLHAFMRVLVHTVVIQPAVFEQAERHVSPVRIGIDQAAVFPFESRMAHTLIVGVFVIFR